MPIQRIADAAERLVYRVAGLPVALSALIHPDDGPFADPLHHAFASRYWHPEGVEEWTELISGILLSPLAVAIALGWFTWRNARFISRRTGKGGFAQLREQLQLYFAAGVLPPWYYIFSLHDDGRSRAGSFIQRFETKTCYFRVLKQHKGSPLNDKGAFADYCAKHGIRTVPTLLLLNGERPAESLPDQDLFVKPTRGRGGRGAQRWDRVGPATFASAAGERLGAEDLLGRLVEESRKTPLIVQPRLTPHPELCDITSGALPTLRVLTCTDELGRPEVMTAMLRTSFGKNRTVDNLHAGGIGALIDLDSGTLSCASNLGSNASLGWFTHHPDTGAGIEGKILPHWKDVKRAALDAHRNFSDRVVIGWDIAVLEDGPIIIEGNGNPDLDILQRFMRVGLREHRLGELLAHHLTDRAAAKTLALAA